MAENQPHVPHHRISNFVTDHKIVTFLIVAAVLFGVYEGVTSLQSSNTPKKYTLSQVQKGTLVSTVSGSGQVLAESQIDLKPKVSGTVTSVKVKEGDKITAGQIIAQLDSSDAQKSVRDAKLNLQSAQIALNKLVQPADKFTLVQAEGNFSQAQRDLKTLTDPPDDYTLTLSQNAVTQAKRDLQQAQINSTQQALTDSQNYQTTLDSGYNSVSNAFVNAPNFITDLKSVQTSPTEQLDDNISSYKLILGTDSVFIANYLYDYQPMRDAYDATFKSYEATPRLSDQPTIVKLINDTLTMEKAVSQNLEDSRNLLNAITNQDYKTFYIAPRVDLLKPKIDADVTAINKDLSALQSAKDQIDTYTQNLPINAQKLQDAIMAAQESLKEKQQALDKLVAGAKPADIAAAKDKMNQAAAALKKVQDGADSLDIQSQKLAVQQRKNALADAQSNLDNYSMKSPFDGVIAKVTSVNGDTALSGQNSASSTAIATIITKQLLAQVSLNEVDAAKVQLQQKATLTFDALPGVSITGQVVQLDTIGTSSQGVVSYNAKVAFDTQDSRIKPGMSVTAAVITQVDQDVLLIPNAALKTQGSSSYVEVFDGSLVTPNSSGNGTGTVVSLSSPQRVTVEAGLANDTQTEITTGVTEGEYVVTQTSTGGTTAANTSAAGGGSSVRIPGLTGGGGGNFGGGRPGG